MKSFLLIITMTCGYHINMYIMGDEFSHAIYLSTIKVELQSQQLDVTIKVFEDDLRDALRAHHGYVIDTTSHTFDQEIVDYFIGHLKIHGAHDIRLLNKDLVGDSFVLNFRYFFERRAVLDIRADYFMELFPTQQHVLHLNVDDNSHYHIFKKGKTWLSIEI